MIDKIKENWEKILLILKEEHEVSDVSYRTWLQPLTPYSFKGNTVTIIVPEQTFLAYVKKKYGLLLKVTISEFLDQDCDVDFKVKDQIEEEKQAQAPSLIQKNKAVVSPDVIQSANLNPKYTFDTFVVGSNNNLAHAAALAVAESPGDTYNPLFIYGGAGLGKTHLMQAIGNKIKANNPNAKIIYVSSENFMNEFITSIREKTGDKFRNKYRAADALLVDDVQFLKNKEATQDEFFHTFNELFNSKKQIVLTSDRLPNELKTLEDRLRTRFGQGLTIDVSVPNFETRVAILQQKALEHNKEIDEDALLYVAEHIRSSVRELEGALLKIISMSEFKKCKITKDFAEEVLKKLIPKSETVTPQNIIKKVSTYYNISESDITGKVKTKEIVVPRQISMYLCRKILNMNDTNIGKEFGKDRTTVGHNIEKIEESIDTNSTIKSDVNYILKDLNYNEG